jgi:hypothetical protein
VVLGQESKEKRNVRWRLVADSHNPDRTEKRKRKKELIGPGLSQRMRQLLSRTVIDGPSFLRNMLGPSMNAARLSRTTLFFLLFYMGV